MMCAETRVCDNDTGIDGPGLSNIYRIMIVDLVQAHGSYAQGRVHYRST
jgi:hypothetical protein